MANPYRPATEPTRRLYDDLSGAMARVLTLHDNKQIDRVQLAYALAYKVGQVIGNAPDSFAEGAVTALLEGMERRNVHISLRKL